MDGMNDADRRREPRFTVGARAILRRNHAEASYPATTINLSLAGVLFELDACSHPFAVGDELTCELVLPDAQEHAFSRWGIGQVVRATSNQVAVQLGAGEFAPEQ